MVSEFKIVLASSSPRRIELFASLGICFNHISPDVEEDNTSMDPIERVERNSLKKAESIQDQHLDSLIIGSDTVVSHGKEIMGKPVDKSDAVNMLRKLSGKCNIVYSGVSVLDQRSGKNLTRHAITKVWFNELSEEHIRDYVNSGEPMDKAGAYGIQGLGGELVEMIEGSYSNVVGLPLELLTEMLSDLGISIEN